MNGILMDFTGILMYFTGILMDSNDFKTWKKCKKNKENTWKIKKQHFKTEKKRKQNKWGKKGTSKREKNGIGHLHFLCIYFAF